MLPIARQARHLGRYRQIAQVLVHHGFGYIVEQLGLVNLLSLPRRIILKRPAPTPVGVAERLRLVLIELGPTFIKFGQLLSTRPDLLPADLIVELNKLQDRVPPFPSDVAIAMIEAELGKPIAQLFRTFDHTPLAAASLGQVHTAVLHSGEQVVVKVQRPDIEQVINTDLAILVDLADLAQQQDLFGLQYDLNELAWDFSLTLRDELDYLREATNADRFRRNFAGSKIVHIPVIYWEYSTHRVLTLERLFGIKINDIAGLAAAGIDRKRLARNSLHLVLEEVFTHGFFHADPHPGNFFALPGGIIGAVDFGQTVAMDAETTRNMLTLLHALSERDPDTVLRALERIGMVSRHKITPTLRRDAQRLINRFVDRPLSELSINEISETLFTISQRHQLQMPSVIAMMMKTMVMIEGTGVQIDPQLDVFAMARPYARRAMAAQYAPHIVGERLLHQARDTTESALNLPHQIGDVLHRLDQSELLIRTREQELYRVANAQMRAANRLAVAMVLAALIISFGLLALAIDISQWDTVWLVVLGVVGGLAMAFLSLVLLLALLRGHDS